MVSLKELIIKLPYPGAPDILLVQFPDARVEITFRMPDGETTKELLPTRDGAEMVALGFPVEENDVPGSVYPPRILNFNENR